MIILLNLSEKPKGTIPPGHRDDALLAASESIDSYVQWSINIGGWNEPVSNGNNIEVTHQLTLIVHSANVDTKNVIFERYGFIYSFSCN